MKSIKIFAGVAVALDFNAAATDFSSALLEKPCLFQLGTMVSGHQETGVDRS
jgi:hypothetical protein